MYEDQIYIAPNYTLNHCKNIFFNLSANSSPEKWLEALDIFQDRMNARFFNGIQILSQYGNGEHWEHNLSFSIIALNCLLIETLKLPLINAKN